MTLRPAPDPYRHFRLSRTAFLLVAFVGLAACQSSPAASTPSLSMQAPVESAPEHIEPGTQQAVAALRSPDFVERSRASERLVAAGIGALPALGAAGDQPVVVHGEARVSTTRPVILAILQAASPESVETKLSSPYAVVRRGAAEELGRRGRWAPIPALLVRLEDPDPSVRAASAASLRRLTNQFFGFSARADVRARTEAAGRWRSWWTQEGRRVQLERDTDTTASIR